MPDYCNDILQYTNDSIVSCQVTISTQKFQEEHWNYQVTIKLAKKTHKTTRTPKCKKNYLVNRKRQTSGPVNTNNEILP